MLGKHENLAKLTLHFFRSSKTAADQSVYLVIGQIHDRQQKTRENNM